MSSGTWMGCTTPVDFQDLNPFKVKNEITIQLNLYAYGIVNRAYIISYDKMTGLLFYFCLEPNKMGLTTCLIESIF